MTTMRRSRQLHLLAALWQARRQIPEPVLLVEDGRDAALASKGSRGRASGWNFVGGRCMARRVMSSVVSVPEKRRTFSARAVQGRVVDACGNGTGLGVPEVDQSDVALLLWLVFFGGVRGAWRQEALDVPDDAREELEES
ncbi:hypothetical protein [Streptomyces griseus]|uniref:hypothetical protein n=1 Tax=Streptomyces griseus TaxID=1911 RepID=UPI0036A78176